MFCNRFFFEAKFDPEWTAVTTFQVMYAIDMTALLSGLETVGPFLALYACAGLKVVCNRFEEMSQSSVESVSSTRDILSFTEVRDCIIFHQKVLKYV